MLTIIASLILASYCNSSSLSSEISQRAGAISSSMSTPSGFPPVATRSLWDILWSCIGTTFLCTWVSVHPNAPFMEERERAIWGRRLYLMLLSLIAPEIIVMWAFKQWRGALQIKKAVNKLFPGSLSTFQSACYIIPTRILTFGMDNPWSLSHAHLLQMGGFRLTFLHEEKDALLSASGEFAYPSECDGQIWHGIVTFDTFKRLLEGNHIDFPTVTEEEIEDKSKGDALSKGITLLQITWFIIQIIARQQQNLVVTQLELTTVALSSLNVAMYVFWWNKPLDLRCPFILQTKSAENYMRQKATERTWRFEEEAKFHLRIHWRESIVSSSRLIWVAVDLFIRSIPAYKSAGLEIFHLCFLTVFGCMFGRHRRSISVFHCSSQPTELSIVGRLCVGINHARRWLWCMISHKPALIGALFTSLPIESILDRYPYSPLEDGKHKLESVTVLDLIFSDDQSVMQYVMRMILCGQMAPWEPVYFLAACAGASFGAIHCFAWNLEFPTRTEQILWRLASLGVVTACTVIMTGILVYKTVGDRWRGKRQPEPEEPQARVQNETPKKSLFDVLFHLVSNLGILSYPSARFSLVILAITSLRQLPPSAFGTVQWTELISHL